MKKPVKPRRKQQLIVKPEVDLSRAAARKVYDEAKAAHGPAAKDPRAQTPD